MKMTKYILKLGNGRYARINAKSPIKAKEKYYSSASHFRTEAYVDSVKRAKEKKIRRITPMRKPAYRDPFAVNIDFL